jgi:predicted GIY-YIG superfamily endonuclease
MYNKILGMVNIYVLFKDNIPFYVGKTKNPKYRINDHKRTFGKDIEFVLIDQVKSSEMEIWGKILY